MKINIGRKNDNTTQDLDYLYDNYSPAKSPVNYNGYYKKGTKEHKWILQLLISGVILLVVAGLFRSEIPFTGALKDAVRYLMTTETNLQPVMNQVVKLATQLGNVEWPTDDLPVPAKPAITQVPSGSLLLLPVSGNVLRNYGWYTEPKEKIQVFNEGLDIAAPLGTVVKASADGTVITVGEREGLGKYILVESKTGELIRYANLAEIKVQKQQAVKAGDIIAKSGKASDEEPYVHFEVIVDGKPVDPLTRLGIDFTKVNGAKRPDQK